MDIPINLRNVIVKNIFTINQLKSLYLIIEKYIPESSDKKQKDLGRLYFKMLWDNDKESVDLPIPTELVDIITSKAIESHGHPLKLESISFARYNLKYGVPNLPPHVDDNFEYARLTFDIQLSSNRLWKIFVEDNDFELHENEGLVFSGTHQVHWREKVLFDSKDYVDMLLCQFSNPSLLSKPINLKFKADIRSRANILKLQYNKKG
jgi:hypothetical protein